MEKKLAYDQSQTKKYKRGPIKQKKKTTKQTTLRIEMSISRSRQVARVMNHKLVSREKKWGIKTQCITSPLNMRRLFGGIDFLHKRRCKYCLKFFEELLRDRGGGPETVKQGQNNIMGLEAVDISKQ